MPRTGKHPGVYIRSRKRGGKLTWYGRWRNPATGDQEEQNLTNVGLTTHALRKAWAASKADELVRKKAKRALGKGHGTLRDCVGVYLDECEGRLRPATVRGYRYGVLPWLDWMEAAGRSHPHHVERTTLFAWRGVVSGQPLTAETRNSKLNALRIFLQHLRRRGATPHLDSDAIRDALANLQRPRPAPKCLNVKQLAVLLEAAQEHDALRHNLTRSGGTDVPKHRPALPLLLLVMLTGCRVGEVLSLRWDQVDLGARPAGVIRLGTETKTKRARVVDLEVCPSVHLLLELLPRDGELVLPGGGWTSTAARRIRERLRVPFRWKDLRSTCASDLCNAPGIWGGSSAYRTARQLGHSVEVSERHYAGLLRGIDPQAATLEAAMELPLMERDIRQAAGDVNAWARAKVMDPGCPHSRNPARWAALRDVGGVS